MNRKYTVTITDVNYWWPYWYDEFPELHEGEEAFQYEDSLRIIVSGKDEEDVIDKLHNSKIRKVIDTDGYWHTLNELIGCKIGQIMLKENS